MRISRTIETCFKFIAAIARINNVRVAVNQRGRYPRAIGIVDGERLVVCGQIALLAHPCNHAVFDRQCAVADFTITTIATIGHGGKLGVEPKRVPVVYAHFFAPLFLATRAIKRATIRAV